MEEDKNWVKQTNREEKNNGLLVSSWINKKELQLQMYDILAVTNQKVKKIQYLKQCESDCNPLLRRTKSNLTIGKPKAVGKQDNKDRSVDFNRDKIEKDQKQSGLIIKNETFMIERQDAIFRFLQNPQKRIKRISNLSPTGNHEYGVVNARNFARDYRDKIVFKKVPTGYKIIGIRATNETYND